MVQMVIMELVAYHILLFITSIIAINYEPSSEIYIFLTRYTDEWLNYNRKFCSCFGRTFFSSRMPMKNQVFEKCDCVKLNEPFWDGRWEHKTVWNPNRLFLLIFTWLKSDLTTAERSAEVFWLPVIIAFKERSQSKTCTLRK